MIDAARNFDLYLHGAWTRSSAPQRIERRHPASGERVATYAQGHAIDINRAVDHATAALAGPWNSLSRAQRSALILVAAELLDTRSEEFARVESDETGKPFSDALADIRQGVALWRYAAAMLRGQHGELQAELGGGTTGACLVEPVGVVGLITPWSAPFLVTAERLPFMLAAGCTVVHKPSEYASGTALLTGEMLTQAGFPAGVLNVVTGLGNEAGAPLVAHPDVAMLSFAGTASTGRVVMSTAAASLKRVNLELGSRNPVLVFADANLSKAADAIISGFTHNAGQSCLATSHLLVEEGVRTELERLLVDRLRVRFGRGVPQPVATRTQFERLAGLLEEGADTGRLVYGSNSAAGDGSGFHLAPAVFADLPPDSPVLQEEILGPLLTLQSFRSEAEAMGLAAELGETARAAAIWTEDVRRALRCARRLRAARVWVNAAQERYPELPADVSRIETYCTTKALILR